MLKISIFDESGSINLYSGSVTPNLMSVQTKSNLPQQEPLKWNLRKAAVEFGTTVDTLKKSLNQISAEPDMNGLYTTGQLIQARFGELYQEKIRTQRALAQKLELENAVTTGAVLDRRELMRGLTQIADAMSMRIMSCSELPRTAREDLLRELSSVPIVLQETADRQTRLPRGSRPAVEEE
jgi:hypothetical protein